MNPSIWTAIQPIASQAARDFLRTVGVFLASKGLIEGDAGVATFIGAGMAFAGLFWGWFTTKGYLQVGALLKKLTATHTPAAAVEVAKVMPSAEQTGAADKAKAIVSAAGVVKVLLFAFLLSAFLVPAAFAQTGNIQRDIAAAKARLNGTPTPVAKPAAAAAGTSVDPLSKLMSDLANVEQTVVTGVIADITAADADAGSLIDPADATSFKDPISHACYPAEIKFLQSLPVASAPTGSFVVVQLFQKKRDFVAQIQAGLPNYLKLGCAALLGDEVQMLTKSLSLIGVSVAANSLLPGSGFILPTL